MLCKLELEGVGPAANLAADFTSRLNLITGDNGLGKSFLLDAAWFALTRNWARQIGVPRPAAIDPRLQATVRGKAGKESTKLIRFDFQTHSWNFPKGRPDMPGLVIYAQVDGGFSVWDPARNYWQDKETPAFHFNNEQVWRGLPSTDGQWRCNGLYRDWANWQLKNNRAFDQLQRTLQDLSPPSEPLVPGELRRIHPLDAQDYPTIRMPYHEEVPLVFASAAIRRILALSYLLIWAWEEHLQASTQRREDPTPQLVFLMDEVEAHLHPSWQRRILPAILSTITAMTQGFPTPSIQVIATTHSPLVCSSLEPIFNDQTDQTLLLDLDSDRNVTLAPVPFVRRGTSEHWILSPHFHLPSTYSEPAEAAIRRAGDLISLTIQGGDVTKDSFLASDKELRELLSETDTFWIPWSRIGKKKGWLP